MAIAYDLRHDVVFDPGPTDRPDWSCLRIAHERWRSGSLYRSKVAAQSLMLVIDGDGSWRLGAREGRIQPGLWIAYGPTDTLELRVTRRLEHRLLCLRLGHDRRMVATHGLPTCDVVALPDPAAVARLLADALAAGVSPTPRRQAIANHYVPLILETVADQLAAPVAGASGFATYLAARALIDRSAPLPASASAVAAELRVSVEHLTRLFTRHAGMPLARWLRQMRLERAAHLLASTELTLDRIAARVGYGDGFALAKAFRALTGESPGRWRAGVRKGAGQPSQVAGPGR